MTRATAFDGVSSVGSAAGASDRVLEIVDPNMVLDHVDVNDLLDRVDVNRRLDLNLPAAAVQRADSLE